MAWNEHTQMLLETQVFKGKIIDRRKGRGGLIYIVEQEAYPKLVAYKTVQEFESTLSVDTLRIDREAQSWFRFAGHPLVIQPHYVEIWDGVPLICMPYCDGDLRNLVGRDLGLTSVVCLSLQIVKGMIVANIRGMEHHQDIKPENLLYVDLSKKFRDFPSQDVDVGVKYSIRIADFGVANAWRDNHLGGTNAYKAPEQYNAKLYDAFAPDIFAVGLVIAELFQGYHPATTNPNINVWNWRGSKLKNWTMEGKRHFASADNPQAQELLQLVKEMLATDPRWRPSFQQCYDRLASMLEKLSSNTFAQIELHFKYFDYISTYCAFQDEINRQLRLFVIPSQQESIRENFRKCIKELLELDGMSLENILRVHHLTDALHRTCRKEWTWEDKELLIDASRLVVRFVLQGHESITSDCLWPCFSFGDPHPKKLASNIEAKEEILYRNIERLQLLGGYDDQLKKQVDDGSSAIQACRVMKEARAAWRTRRFDQACELLNEVRKLTSPEPELESLYNLWSSTRDQLGEVDSSEAGKSYNSITGD